MTGPDIAVAIGVTVILSSAFYIYFGMGKAPKDRD